MMVTPGTRLGAYEIIMPLGAGGMSEVYKALDTRLDRTIAIKVLSAPLGSDPQFRERFDREAHASRSSIIRTSAHGTLIVLQRVATDASRRR
jgi:serine/threonine protein kinase